MIPSKSQSSNSTNGIRRRKNTLDTQRRILKRTRKYQHISKENKEKLIQLVQQQKLRIKDAALLCNINYSTAKTIFFNLRHKQVRRAGYRQLNTNESQNMMLRIHLKGTLTNIINFRPSCSRS